MPSMSYIRRKTLPFGGVVIVTDDFAHTWGRSPRNADGSLRLESNEWSLYHLQSSGTNFVSGPPAPALDPPFRWVASDKRVTRAQDIANAEVRAQIARDLRTKANAALGMTIASAGQTIDMLSGAAERLTTIFSAAERFYRSTKGRRRLKRFRRLISRGARITAGMVLEGFFGWASLFGDFYQACQVLARPWPPTWVSARKSWKVKTTELFPYVHGSKGLTEWTATGHSTYASGVLVSNPNLWIGNKLGLINPLAILWDKVPWSFLVNMVSNMGSVLGSLSDFAGLTFKGGSLTTKLLLTETASAVWKDPRYPSAVASSSGTRSIKLRRRALAGPPPTTLYLRFPQWEVGTAAIVGSLLIQQTGRLSRVLGID